MKIKSIYIHNFKGIEELQTIPCDGASIILIGGNGTGKTSFIDAIYSVLDSSTMPVKPINKNGDKAKIQLEFQDGDKTYLATLKITDKTKTLSLSMGEFEVKSPHKYLDKLIGGDVNFNPIEFAEMSKTAKGKREQAEVILNILGINLTAIENAITDYKQQRLDSSRRLRDIKKERDVAYGNLPEDKEKYTEAISVTKLLEERTLLNASLQKVQKAQLEQKNIDTNIEEAEKQLVLLNEKLAKLNERKKGAIKFLEENKDIVEKGKEIDAKIANSEAHNKAYNLTTNYDGWEQKYGAEETVHKNLDLNVKAENSKKLKIIEARCNELKFPFKLYVHDDGSIFVDEIPIEQLNTAKQIEVGIELYMNTNPKLKILRLNNLSLCDTKTKEAIAKIINEKGYQAFVEIVEPDSEDLTIEIQEELKL